MIITPNFSLIEFHQPARHGMMAMDYPQAWIEERLRPLCEAVEVIRATLEKPITILSGYRSPGYNLIIGGAKSSQHMQGRAADITVEDWAPEAVHATILHLFNEGKIKIGGLGAYPGFCHVDIRTPPADNPRHLAQWTGSRTMA